MNDAAEHLWNALTQRGVTLSAKDGKIALSPSDLLTEGDVADVRDHKPALLALLSKPLPVAVVPDDLAVAEAVFADELVDWRQWQAAVVQGRNWNATARRLWLEYIKRHPMGKNKKGR